MSHLPIPFFTAVKAIIRHEDKISLLQKNGPSVSYHAPDSRKMHGRAWVADYLSQRGFS